METKVFVKSLHLWSLCFVKIDNVPLLCSTSIVAGDYNWATFSIFATLNIKNFAGLPVDKLVVLVLEYLPPIRVCAPDSHAVGSSIVSDVKGLVVVSGSDGQRLLMEVPHLSSSSVGDLDHHVSIVDDI
jgi:hypothetical protein